MKNKCCYAGCKEEVVGSYSVDIDIDKFYYCKKHKDNVSRSLLWAVMGHMELSNAELGLPTNPPKIKTRFKVTRTSGKKTKRN